MPAATRNCWRKRTGPPTEGGRTPGAPTAWRTAVTSPPRCWPRWGRCGNRSAPCASERLASAEPAGEPVERSGEEPLHPDGQFQPARHVHLVDPPFDGANRLPRYRFRSDHARKPPVVGSAAAVEERCAHRTGEHRGDTHPV